MKTLKSILVSAVAVLFWVSVAGCQSADSPGAAAAVPAGPATNAAKLSGKKTFAIIGRTGSTITYSKPDGPQVDVASGVIRTKLESLGYQEQSATPDFVVSVAWDQYKKMVQPSPTDPQATSQEAPVVAVDQATLGITVRDSMTGAILWQNPASGPVDPHMVTDDQVRSLTTEALKDFPPSQPATK